MPRGSISQNLRISKIPDGLKMYITDVHLNIPEGKNNWWPNFSNRTILICPNTEEEKKKAAFPFEVSPSLNDGYIGNAALSSTSVFDSGEGPSIEIDYVLMGEISANGKTTPVGQRGSITVSSSEWGGWMSLWGNASDLVLAYNLVGSGTQVKDIKIPTSGHTKDLFLGLAVNKAGDGLALNIDVEENWIVDGVNLLLGGVYWAHDITYGTVFGALGGWPAALKFLGLDGLRKYLASKV